MEQIMQMKILTGFTPIVLLLYLIIREFFSASSEFSSSISQHDQPQDTLVSQNFFPAKPSYIVVFFAFNLIVVAILVGISSQFSSFSSSSSEQESILSLTDPYEGLNSTKYEDYEVYNDDLAPLQMAFSDQQSYDDYCFNKVEEIIARGDDQEEENAKDLIKYECCGYDHEETREEDVYSTLTDDDFNKRIEEFIDENNKIWREDLQNERLIYVDRLIS